MNLQMMSLLTLVKSCETYDKEDPVIQDVLFDIDLLIHKTDDNIRTTKKRFDYARKHLYRNIVPPLPSSQKYDQLVDDISILLFDDISYDRITTDEQIEWKEYFHGLYDLVIYPYYNDKTHHIQMVNELYKYFTVLEPPKKHLDPRDPLYVDVEMCNDLFRHLKAEHKKMMTIKLFKKLRKCVKVQISRRIQLRKMELQLKKLYKLRADCYLIVYDH
jgi:hypothetical protein